MNQLTRRNLLLYTSAGLAFASVARPLSALAQDGDLPTVVVGSKDFTESVVLAELSAVLLEDAGYTVERQLNLGGTAVVHEAIVNGEVDVYVEYTGTGLIAVLDQELPEMGATASPEAGATPAASAGIDPVYEIVAAEYPEQFGLEWLQPWGFNNTYALAMRRSHAEELGIETISDLAGHAGELTIGAPQETLVREDGIPGLEETYDMNFGDVVGLDPGLMYSAVAEGEVDVITSFSTDGRIQSMDLVLLEDDLGFYPPYYAAPVVRQDLLEASPEVADILNQLSGEISEEEMIAMNFEADENGVDTSEVARSFLIEEGLIDN